MMWNFNCIVVDLCEAGGYASKRIEMLYELRK